jgi:hypothetical protein
MRQVILMAGLLASIPTPLVLSVLTTASTPVLAQEEDDTLEGAARMGISSRKRSTLLSVDDVDFYRFGLRRDRDNPEHDTSGNLTVTFSQKAPPGANPDSGWRLDLYAESDLANPLYTTVLPETSLITTFEQGISPGNYYFKVSSINNVFFPQAQYTLQTKWEKNSHYEKPPNNEPDDATALRPNETYFGNLSSHEDKDFYRFSLEIPDTVTLILTQETPGADNKAGWTFSLVGHPQKIAVPSTQTVATLPLDLGIGTHYLEIAPLVVVNEEMGEAGEVMQQETAKAAIGRRYQIRVEAPTVPIPPTECPQQFIYGQHPLTQRWVAFPTLCEVPAGWFNTQIAPEEAEVCPSPHATYKPTFFQEDGTQVTGKMTIPLVDFIQDNQVNSIWRAELAEIPGSNPLQFQILLDKVRLIQQVVEIPEETPPPVEENTEANTAVVETPVGTP